MYNNGNSSKNVTGASVVDGTMESADFADDGLSGDKVHGGTISGSVTLVTPDIGTPNAGVLTNCSGTASSLTAGNVTTNANLTGVVTSSGNATAIADNAISGDKIDAGIISNFQSTGIDDNATSTAITIDASENVGINQTAPVNALHIGGPDGSSYIKFTSDATGHTGSDGARIGLNSDDLRIINAETSGHMLFQTAATERMRIDSGGTLRTTSSDGLAPAIGTGCVSIWGRSGSSSTGILRVYKTGDDGRVVDFYRTGNTFVGSISVTGSSTSYNTSSDYRLKENVVPMTGSIDRVKALKPSKFNFISDTNTTVDGFLAHEAGEVVPEAVTGDKDATSDVGNITDSKGNIIEDGDSVKNPETLETGHTWTKTGQVEEYQAIDQSKLVPLLVGALQEAITRIEQLENI